MASDATRAFYDYGGGLLLAGAANAHETRNSEAGSPNQLLEVLEEHFRNYTGGLATGTVCVYRQHVRAAIAQLVGAGADADVAAATELAIMVELRGRPEMAREARGPAMKIEVPEKAELADVFGFLKRRFFSEGHIEDLLLSLYILIMPRIGLRPIEITWARREGPVLKVATAKRQGRPEREVPLTGWPEDYLFALDVLLALVPRSLDAADFKKWRNALASRLARASKHSCKRRRLALYCCRHIAFATWRDVGMSPDQIRRLAGHAGLGSQRAYARGKTGFGARWMFRDVISPPLSDVSTNANDPILEPAQLLDGPPHTSTDITEDPATKVLPAAQHREAATDSEQAGPNQVAAAEAFEFDPFPRPKVSRQDGIDPREHFERVADAVANSVDRYARSRAAVKETVRHLSSKSTDRPKRR